MHLGNHFFGFLVFGMFAYAAFIFLAPKKFKKGHAPIVARPLLTQNEQPMFVLLQKALPKCSILIQVSFNALITTTDPSTRNKFNRKMADFVVIDHKLEVVAIVELDDSSHRGRERQDAARDALLVNAGYKIIRYKFKPEIDKIKQDFKELTSR